MVYDVVAQQEKRKKLYIPWCNVPCVAFLHVHVHLQVIAFIGDLSSANNSIVSYRTSAKGNNSNNYSGDFMSFNCYQEHN